MGVYCIGAGPEFCERSGIDKHEKFAFASNAISS